MRTLYMIFMSLSVFILSSVLFIKQNTTIIFGDSADLYTINVSVEKKQTPEQIDSILKQIQEAHPQFIQKVTLISSKDLVADVEKVLPAYSSGLFENDELEQILNPVIEVQMTPEANSADLISRIKTIPGINDVTFSADWVEKFKSFFSVANIVLDTIFILFFVILSFLIAVLIRNYLINAKESISIHALLGATPQQAFIKSYQQIMVSTVISYALGLVLTAAMALIIKQKIANNADFSFINSRLNFLNATNISIIAAGLALNLLISYLLSYQYINKEYYKHE